MCTILVRTNQYQNAKKHSQAKESVWGSKHGAKLSSTDVFMVLCNWPLQRLVAFTAMSTLWVMTVSWMWYRNG
jgi:hypothetical protein